MKFNKKSTAYFLFVLCIITLVSACKDNQNKTVNSKETFTNDIALDSFFTTLYKKGMFNGAVAVKKNGKLIFKKGYGIANYKKLTPFLPSTAMEIASVSKQFTTAAVQILAQQNKLDINEYAYKYLGKEFPYHQIKIIHLLTHTSGLVDYEDYFKKEWDTSKIAYNQDILNYFIEKKPTLMSIPGETYHYSNSAFVLLAVIIKRISGKSLDVFLNENIFKMANMKNSDFWERDSIWTAKNYAPGYMLNPKNCDYENPEVLSGKQYYRFLSGRLGSGRLSSSVNDLIKWDSILYTNTILNKESKALAFTPHPPSKDTSDYGFGWHIPDTSSKSKVIYHTGSWAGNRSYIKRFLASKSMIVILNNNNSVYNSAIRKEVDRYVAEGTPLSIPQQLGSEVLERDICNLNQKDILVWFEKNQHLKWDKKELIELKEKYLKSNNLEKVGIISQLIGSL